MFTAEKFLRNLTRIYYIGFFTVQGICYDPKNQKIRNSVNYSSFVFLGVKSMKHDNNKNETQ